MNTNFLRGLFLSAFLSLFFTGLFAQNSVTQPDSVCVGGTEFYRVDSTPGSKYVWSIKGGAASGTILTPADDSAAHIQVQWVSSLGFDTLIVVEYNQYGCNGVQNKLRVERYSTPTATLSSTSIDICEGLTLNLSVTPTGLTPYSYQWQRGGVDIPGALGATLVIPNVDASHSGTYTCIVTNPCGMTTSNSCLVTVQFNPVITLQPVLKTSTCPGANISLLVNATGTEPLVYQWKLNGVNVINDAHIAGATTNNLVITGMLYADTGFYTCTISNMCTEVTTTTSHVTINIPPVITIQPDSVSTCENLTALFATTVTGDSLFYQWKKEGVDIPGAVSSTLSFNPVAYADTANYVCVIHNTCGTVTTQNALLNINIPPTIVSQPDSVSTCVDLNTFFAVSVVGDSLYYQWKKEGMNLPGANQPTLVFTPATYSDTANYKCAIYNTCGSVETENVLLNMNIPPLILIQPDSVSICNGQNTSFVTGVFGDSLFYQWKKNGLDIPGATNSGFYFTPATYADTADYVCVITNTCGTETTINANLNMNIPPVIVNQPDSVSICDGQNTQFFVGVTGDSLFYQWKKNAVDIVGATSPTLTFTPALYSDTADYVCVISNTCGTVTTQNANLNMNIPPVVINQPDSVSTCPGQSVSFTTIVTGDSLNYQWLKNGANMPGKTTNVLSFPSVAYSDTADYVCHITNTCGEVYTVNANLNINIPPVIVSQPVTQSSCLGYSETFTVVATGDSLFYQWKRNGIDIPGATANSYTVNPVSLANVGSYTCLVSNTCGSQLSNPAILTVNIAPVITVHPKKTSSCIGNSVTLNVVATGDSLFYQWRRNGVDIAGATSNSYTINPVTNLNTGDYTCYVWNTCGAELSQIATLSVNITPFITIHPVTTSSCIGNTVVLNVTATGDSLMYQWRRNGIDIPSATSSSITISPVSLANVGNYTCFVYNTCGSQLSNVAALSVNQVPVITQQPVKLSSCVGYTAIFTVLTTGDSLFYQWRKNGVDMPGKTSNVLTIMPVTYADTATYTCYINNTCGFILSNPAKLTVNRVPVVTVHPKTTSTCVGASITLNCAASGDSLFYQWRFNGVDMPGKTNPTLTINPVAYADTGFYSVRIWNTCGTAITNAGKVTVNIVPVITTQPKNISTCPGGNVTISTVVTGDSLFYQWRKNGFDMPGATNSSITFNPVAYTDTADYRCYIHNTCGTAVTSIANLNINIPPVITSQPLDLLTCVGDPTFFTLGVTGDSLFYQWRFNGGNIPTGTNPVLTINPVTLASIGSYDVVIHNTCGTVTSNPAELFANIDPSVVVDPVSQSSCLGQTEVFTVGIVAAGSALPNFQWYKDGVAIPGANTDTYTVTNINLAKTGAYYCELSNNCDVINTEVANLTVNIAPVITEQPQNISTCIGNAESFVVVATGDSLFYQWYKDGFPVSGATTATLSFNPVAGSHIGFYYCHIWNTCGTVNTQPVQLYMNTPPTITLQPVNQKACAGDNVVLQALATGDFLSYQWYKDGAILTGATSNVLQYNPVDYSARGQYYCRIQNNCGIINTNAVYIWVNTTPIITQQPQGMSTCAGENITLSVTALGDSIAYQWKLEGIDIPGANTNTYSISNIQFSQTGNYTCYMSTRCGNIMTEQAKVTINRVPNVTLEPTDVNACAGDLVVLDFGIFGDSLNFQWYKDGTSLTGATTQTLTFPAITIVDRGLYKCHIWNTCGEDWTLTINVWVNILPGVTQQPVAQTRCEDDTVSFHMTAIGDFITLQWYHDNTIIPGATSNSYSIAKIALADGGQYFCRVTSQSCGYFDTDIITLTVVQKFVVNSVTENVTCYGAGDASIDLTLAGATPPVNYLWNTGETTEDLSGLQPGYYTVFIKDQNNCQERKTVEIMQPNVLDYVHDTTSITNALRMGGLGNDMVTGIKTDLNGNTYVTGRFQATANFQTQTLTSFGDDDIFVAKYNTAGNLSWIKQAGGTLKDQGLDLSLDSLGNIYVTGIFTQMAFFEATMVNAVGNADAFLAKYDNNGNLQWVKSLGGFFDDAANGVHSDNEGYTWIAGSFQGISTFGTETLISAGGDDAFVSKFSPSGNIQWTKQAGGTSEDFAHDVVVDISDDAIITGRFQGTASFGTSNLVTTGNNDAFVAKYGPTGNLKWTRKAGGTGNDLGRSIAVDQSQNIYTTGSFEGNASFGVNSAVSNGLKDAFVAKYDKDGNSQWVRGIGGTMVDNAKSIEVDALGNSFIAGTFRNTMQLGDKTLTAAGQNDMFMAKYSTTGYLVWSQQIGGTGADSAMVIALRPDKNLLVGGSFSNSVMFGGTSLTSEGGDDAFMFRLNQLAVPTPPVVTQVNCFGGNEGSLNITIGGGTLPYTYNWSTGETTEDLANIPVGTYWLFINDVNDCAIDTMLVVTSQFQLPTPPTSASVDRDYFCTDDPGNITLTATGGSGDVLSWYEGSCGGTLVGNGASLSIASPTVTTTYYARWENVCDSSICAPITVHVIDMPTAPSSVSTAQNPICEGTDYITLNAVGGQGEVLKWYTGSCGGTEVGTGSPLTLAAPTVPTTYYARWETACGPSDCDSIDITVTPLPEPVTSITATETTICYNATNVITLTATGGSGDELRWTTGDCNGTVFNYGPTIVIDPPTVTTTYYAYWKNACGSSPCESVTIEVLQQTVAPAEISVSDNFFCEGTVGQLTLTATGAQNGVVRWYEGFCGSPTYLGEGTTLTIAAPTATTTYYARTESLCPNPSECIWQTVTVYPTPVVFFQGLDPDYCVNESPILLTGNQATGAFSGSNAITNNGDGTAWFSPAVAGVGGPYSIKFAYTSPQGCYNEEIQQVTVHALPFVNFTGLAANYCVNATATTLYSNQLTGTFTCSNPAAISDLGNGTATFDPALAGVGTHTVTFTYSDLNGCINSITKQVEIIALPVVAFAGLLPAYCVDHQPVLMTGNHAPYGLFNGLGVTNIGLGQALFVPSAAGVGGPYAITYTYSNANGCSNTATQDVTVNDLPVADFVGLELSYCLNSPQDTLTGNMVPLGNFSGPGITNNNNGTAYFNASAAGAGGPYSIVYSYTDGNGCSDTETKTTVVNTLPVVSFSGLNPMYCVNADPIMLQGNKKPFGTFTSNAPTGALTDNFNGTASFDPALAGAGTWTITYTYNDNNNCSNSQTKSVIINPLPVVSFTGLEDTYCINGAFDVLTGNQLPNGTFSGPGIENLNNGKARFHPSQAGLGAQHIITYTYIDNNACQASFNDTTEVIDLPVIQILSLEPAYCIEAGIDTIVGSEAPMGSFSGPGVNDLTIGKALFDPAAAGLGTHLIHYSFTDPNGCSKDTAYQVTVNPMPEVSFNTLAASYCVNANPVILVGSHKPNGAFTGTGVVDYGNGTGLFEPATAGVGGPYIIKYIYTDPNGCADSTQQTTSVTPLAVMPDSIVSNHNNFCTGTVPNITLSVVGGSGNTVRWFTGSCGGTEIGTGTSLQIPAPADTTKYFARWENTCNVTECDSIQINIIHYAIAPETVIVDSNNFCSTVQDSIQLTAVGGFGQTFKWFSDACGTGTLVGTGTPLKIAAPLETTTYYGRWETGCGPSACKDVLVTVRPQPIALDSVTSNHNDFCAGTVTNLVLKAYGGAGEQLEWYADSCGGAVLGLGNQITVPAPDTITTYYARWMNSCDTTVCESILINVFPQPVAPDSISADNNNYCSGTVGIVTLTAFGGSGDTLFWYQDACNEPSIGYSTTPSTLLINAPTETTTYFARYKNNCGESVCTSFTLNVIPQPMVPDTLTVDTNYFCQAYNGIIILNGFGGVGDTLQWYSGSCGGTYEGKGTELRIPAPDTTTWYFARWKNPCGESLCDSILVVVNEPIAVDSVYADDTLFCFNDPGQLTLVAAGGYGQQINWYKNGCGTAVVGTGDTLVLNSPTITTTYFARWENYCGITECDSVKVTVIPEAIKPDYIESDTNYFCPGSVANINLTAVGGLGDTTSTLGETLRWFLGSCGGTEIGTGLSINIPAPVVTTKYYARWENTCGVSECTEIEIVVDIPFPVTSVSVDTNNFCPGAVTDITLMSSGGYGTSLKWYKYENGAYVNLATGQPLNVFAPDTTTTYYVRWENVCGQSAWDSIVVVVNEPFAPPVLSADSNGYCSDYGLPLQLSGLGGNGDTLRWFTQSCGGVELGTGNPLTITAPTETTTLYARYENVCGVSECSSFILNVVPAPTLFAGTLDSVCEAGAYSIANTWAENHTSILWTTTGTGTFDDATSLTPVYTLGNDDVVDQDTVHLIMSVQGMSPCGIYTDTLTLLINPLPVIGFMPSDTAICRDSSLVVLTSGAMTYDWRPLAGINQVNDQVFVANPSQSTNYKVIGTSASGCVDSTDYNITVYPTPVVNLGEDQYLFTCEPVVLNAGSGSGSEQYEWQDGSVKQTFKVEENGTYWVKVSNNGCSVMDTIQVQICEGYIWMPTAFTPNNDGVNEVFLARSSDLTIKFQLYIYSRNGLLIYQTDDISKGWDGRDLKGEMCNSGVYVWKVVYQGDGIKSPGVEKTQSGVVTLIR